MILKKGYSKLNKSVCALILSISLALAAVGIIDVNSRADDNYLYLSQYYSVLSLQGGNDQISSYQALALSQYYYVLATNPNGIQNNTSQQTNTYAYYDPKTVTVYMSTAEPNCSHKHTYQTRYVTDGRHAVFCPDCYVIFKYDRCYYDNNKYPALTDYMHDRCLVCYHKYE